MPQAVSRQPPRAEVRVLTGPSNSYEVFGGQSDIRTGFSLCTFVFPCQYHSTNAPYQYSSTLLLSDDKPYKTGNVPQSNALSETRGYWIEKYFHFWVAVNQLTRWIKMESYCAMCSSVSFPRNPVHSISAKKNRILKVKLGSAMISYQLNDEDPHIYHHFTKPRAYTYRYTYVLPSLTANGARMKH